MTATVRDPAAVVDLLCERIVGRRIRALEVYGINSLKTQDPPLAALTGKVVSRILPTDGALFTIQVDGIDVVVDLQRVGGVRVADQLGRWAFGAGPQPTMRLLFEDGGGVEFKEPSKTKRITVRLLATAG